MLKLVSLRDVGLFEDIYGRFGSQSLGCVGVQLVFVHCPPFLLW